MPSDAGTFQVGKVRYQPPLPSVMSLRDHSKAVQVEILGVAIMEWAQEMTFSSSSSMYRCTTSGCSLADGMLQVAGLRGE